MASLQSLAPSPLPSMASVASAAAFMTMSRDQYHEAVHAQHDLYARRNPFGRVRFTQIRWLSDPEIIASSVVEVKEVSRVLQGPRNVFSLYDTEMGSASLNRVCPTCNKTGCDGHRGYIALPEAVYKYNGLDAALRLLKCVCGGCGMPVFRLRDGLDAHTVRHLRRGLRVEDVHPSERDVREVLKLSARMDDQWQRFTQLADVCHKRAGTCARCTHCLPHDAAEYITRVEFAEASEAAVEASEASAAEAAHGSSSSNSDGNGGIQCGMMRPRYSRDKDEGAVIRREWNADQLGVMDDEERFLLTAPFLPRDAFKVFDMVPPAVLKLFGFLPEVSHPKWLVTWVQPVSPPALRPRSRGNGVDDTTKFLEDIVHAAKEMRAAQAAFAAVEERVIPLRLRHADARRRVAQLSAIPPAERTSQQAADLAAAIRERDDSQPGLRRALKTFAEKQAEYAREVAELQCSVSSLINSDMQRFFHKQNKRERFAKQTKEKRDLQHVLGTKRGKFRQELGGRRVLFVLRTVIEASVGHNIGEVGVPKHLCVQLTKPEAVTLLNLQDLQARIIRGAGRMNGAAAVKKIDPYTGEASLRDLEGASIEERRDMARELAVGWVVLRYIKAGDAIMFNRQPTLHKHSILSGIVRPTDGYALEIELATLEQQNGDFDGDEENGHIMQNILAEVECHTLLAVPEQLGNERTCYPIVGLVQDSRSGAYLLTRRDVLFDAGRAMQTLMQLHFRPKVKPSEFAEIPRHVTDEHFIADNPTLEDLPPPAILLPRRRCPVTGAFTEPRRRVYWTGKQLFSCLLPQLDYELGSLDAARIGKARDDIDETKCVLVRSGELLVGRLKSNCLGAGTRGFVHTIKAFLGAGAAANFISDAQRLLASGPFRQALSIGLSDCRLPDAATAALVRRYIDTAVARFGLRCAGADPRALPREALNELELLLNRIGPLLTEALPDGNGLRDTILSGAKGKPTNIAMILGCLGLQSIRGAAVPTLTVPCGLTRTLCTSPPNPTDAESHGFIAASYMTGLNPVQFFWYMASGREGLTDTALKTAESGYMQRRLGKAQGHDHLNQLGQVVTGNGMLLAQAYGGDGFDASRLQRLSALWLWTSPETFVAECLGGAVAPPAAATTRDALGYFRLLRAWLLNTVTEGDRVPETLQAPVNVPELLTNVARGNFNGSQDMDWARRCVPQPDAPASDSFLRACTTALLLGITRGMLIAPALPVGLATLTDDIFAAGASTSGQIVLARQTFAAAVSPGVPDVAGLKALLLEAAQPQPASMSSLVAAVTRQDAMLQLRCLYALWLHPEAVRRVVYNVRKLPVPTAAGVGLSRAQVAMALQMILMRTMGARAAPGENVGTLSSTCIGEPTTQMVLNTFHMAGVNVKTVTRGMPRILELVDAANTARSCGSLVAVDDEEQAASLLRELVGRRWADLAEAFVVERCDAAPAGPAAHAAATDAALESIFQGWSDARDATHPWLFTDARVANLTVGGIKALKASGVSTKSLLEAYRPAWQLRVVLRPDAPVSLFDAAAVLQAIVERQATVTPVAAAKSLLVRLAPTAADREEAALEDLRRKLLRMHTAVGLEGITAGNRIDVPRLVPYAGSRRDSGRGGRHIAAASEATGLGVDLDGAIVSAKRPAVSFTGSHLPALLALAPQTWAPTAYSNNVIEVKACLGIEAARIVYLREFFAAVSEETYVDPRHLDINVLTMAQTGLLLGSNRHHMARAGSSMLATAGFEETTGQLGRSATFAAIDELQGHTARIFVGQPIKTGTGMVELLEDVPAAVAATAESEAYDPEFPVMLPTEAAAGTVRRRVELEAAGITGMTSSSIGGMQPSAFDETAGLLQQLQARGGDAVARHGRVAGFVGRVNGQPLMGEAANATAAALLAADPDSLAASLRNTDSDMLVVATESLVAALAAWDAALVEAATGETATAAVPVVPAADATTAVVPAAKRQRVMPAVIAVPAAPASVWRPGLAAIPPQLEVLVKSLQGFLTAVRRGLPNNIMTLELRLGSVFMAARQATSDMVVERQASTSKAAKGKKAHAKAKAKAPAASATASAATTDPPPRYAPDGTQCLKAGLLVDEQELDLCLRHGVSAEHFAAIRARLSRPSSPWQRQDPEAAFQESLSAASAASAAVTAIVPDADADAATTVALTSVMQAAAASAPLFLPPGQPRDMRPHTRELMQDVYYTMRDGTAVRSSCEYGTSPDTIRNCRSHVIKTATAERLFSADAGRPGDLHVALMAETSLPVSRVLVCVNPSLVRIKLRETWRYGPWALHLTEAWQGANVLELMETLRHSFHAPLCDVKLELAQPETLFANAAMTPLQAAKSLVCLLPFVYGDAAVSGLPTYSEVEV